jgi:hypothetical protein
MWLCKSWLLLSKLSFYGIQNLAGQWLTPYLHDRKQQEEIKSPDSNNSAYSDWGIIYHGVPLGVILGPLLFLVYIIDLSPTINYQYKPTLFANDTNIIISPSVIDCFQNYMNDVFASLNKCIKAHKFTLDLDKTNSMKFWTINKARVNLNIGYDDKTTVSVIIVSDLEIKVVITVYTTTFISKSSNNRMPIITIIILDTIHCPNYF